eukprot:322178-Alexandrium_andersonii.AAC.1
MACFAAHEDPIDLAGERGEIKKATGTLYYFLVMTCTSSALLEVKGAPVGNGGEAWGRLTRRFAPPTTRRSVGLLQAILNPKFPENNVDEFVDGLARR